MTTANEPLQTKLRFSRVSKRIARPVYSGRPRDGTDEPQEVSIILPSRPSQDVSLPATCLSHFLPLQPLRLSVQLCHVSDGTAEH